MELLFNYSPLLHNGILLVEQVPDDVGLVAEAALGTLPLLCLLSCTGFAGAVGSPVSSSTSVVTMSTLLSSVILITPSTKARCPSLALLKVKVEKMESLNLTW